jgi:lysine 2,3-aminomutase
MAGLFKVLVQHRVRPYDLHLADPAAGTAHFRTGPQAAIALAKALRGHVSGLCQPHLLIDLPEGGGKVPLAPRYVKKKGREGWEVESFRGNRVFVDLTGKE